MEIIDKNMLEKAKELEPTKQEIVTLPNKVEEKEIDQMLLDLENPVNAQKYLAVKIKIFLDHRIDLEMGTKGVLSDHTRRWVESYNGLLGQIQKALHGDKSVNLHLHQISHSQIAAKIRNIKE